MAKKGKEKGKEKEILLKQKIVLQRQSFSKKDIADWVQAVNQTLASTPKWNKLQELYNNILLDGHLLSQINIRKNKILSLPYQFMQGDTEVEIKPEHEHLISQLFEFTVDSIFFGYSLIEVDYRTYQAELIDRRHIDPKNKLLYFDLSNNGQPYTQFAEYGKTLFDINTENDGLLKQAIPHVLFKRFAQACWSEHAEIYGSPSRYVKTNTQDKKLVAEYKEVLANIGSGASYVLDFDDEIGFVNSNATNGEIYEKLMHVCSNELSLLICGAIIGQDTINGSNAKEKASQDITEDLIEQDKKYISQIFNFHLIPSLISYGILPAGTTLKYPKAVDNSELFAQTMQLATHYDIDTNWITEKFGIPVLGVKSHELRAQSSQPTTHSPHPKDFFV